jgi:2-dehydro-3-deoxyphosphogluconate aldolase/(4S)-4-hydroxy-2-oxoglutarate aldolase
MHHVQVQYCSPHPARSHRCIIRSNDADAALKISEACIEGGITALEISFTTPDALDIIKTLSKCHGERALIGAGTVLDPETARMAILAGSKFILSPSLDKEVLRVCSRYQVVSMPGVATATEVVQALEGG